MQCFALPLGIATGSALVMLWIHLTPVAKTPVAYPALLVGTMLAIFPVHELLHALVHPRMGMSRNTILGLWLSRQLFYAHYTGELSRNRFIAILGMPLLVISAVPLLTAALIGHASVTVAFASCFNALAAGGDLFAVCILLFQVPRTAMIPNKGYRTYWKSCGKSAPTMEGSTR
jgi:Putative zincin peptidase